MKIGIVVNDVGAEKAGYSTTHLALEAIRSGHDVSYLDVGAFEYAVDELVHAHTHPVSHRSDLTPAELVGDLASEAGGKKQIAVEELDVLLLRSDPSRELFDRPWARLAGVNFGRLVARHGVLVLNDPDGLDRAINKMYLQLFPRSIRPEAMITRDRSALRSFAEREGPVVIKPLTGSGGRKVFLIEDPENVNFKQMVESVLLDGYVLAQQYLPAAQAGDVRLFMMNGKILQRDGRAAIVRRERPAGDMRSNLSVGGRSVPADVTPAIERVAEQLGPRLVADGMFLVGVDLVEGKVLEINVFSPGALVGASRLAGVNFFAEIVEALERKVDRLHGTREALDNAVLAATD